MFCTKVEPEAIVKPLQHLWWGGCRSVQMEMIDLSLSLSTGRDRKHWLINKRHQDDAHRVSHQQHRLKTPLVVSCCRGGRVNPIFFIELAVIQMNYLNIFLLAFFFPVFTFFISNHFLFFLLLLILLLFFKAFFLECY